MPGPVCVGRWGRLAVVAAIGIVLGGARPASADFYVAPMAEGGLFTGEPGSFQRRDDPTVGESQGFPSRFYRAFLAFDLSGLNEPIEAIDLVGSLVDLRRSNLLLPFAILDTYAELTVRVVEVETPLAELMNGDPNAALFASLGGGASYGRFTVDNGLTLPPFNFDPTPPPLPPIGPAFDLTLNPAALAAANEARVSGHAFVIGFDRIGGFHVGPTTAGIAVIGDLSGVQLRIRPRAVPAPPAAPLAAIGLAVIGARLRRRRSG